MAEVNKIENEDNTFFKRMFVDLIYRCSDYVDKERTLFSEDLRSLESKLIYWFEDKELNITADRYKEIRKQIDEEPKMNIESVDLYLSRLYRDKEWEKIIKREGNVFNKRKYTYTYGYLILLKAYLQVLNDHPEPWSGYKFPIFPYLSISPTVLFDRMLVQEGLFLYQPSIYKQEDVYDTQLFLTQEIKPDVTLRIKNKEQIVKELDSIGINQSTLFPDPDNIAKYMKGNSKYHLRIKE